MYGREGQAPHEMRRIKVYKQSPRTWPETMLWHGDVAALLAKMPAAKRFDLIVSSPPYNIGKAYESRKTQEEYVAWQRDIIESCVAHLADTGSICWQVGNHVKGTKREREILPLEYLFHPIFADLGLKLRNRIVWHFGHGHHSNFQFSGRHEAILWYTKSDRYTFNLDPVRVEQKYAGKKAYRGPRKGQYSSNPMGKNPSDVWELVNVKSMHVEKTGHPCQFPVALVQRLIRALTNEGDSVFDPFAGVASAGVAALLEGRAFWGAEINEEYIAIGSERLAETLRGTVLHRPLDRQILNPAKAGKVALNPWKNGLATAESVIHVPQATTPD